MTTSTIKNRPSSNGEGVPHFGEPKRIRISYSPTDAGNARRFADQHGKDVRYCHTFKKWLVWNGKCWAKDATGEVMRLAKDTAASIYGEAAKEPDSREREILAKWAIQSERCGSLRAMIELAQSELPIPITVDKLDADPWLLNCENGTIDLRTGELREHRQSDYCTKIVPVPFPTGPYAAPLWDKFLETVFAGKTEQIQFIRRLFGVSLVGEQPEHILPIFYGTGANGKSVLINTWLGFLGPDYAMKAPHNLLMQGKTERHSTEIADLEGKRFVAAVETEDGSRLKQSMVKDLTGGESVRARKCYQDSTEFRSSHTIVMATNHKPLIGNMDHGIWRRIRLVQFNITIPENQQDKQLPVKLRAEYPMILLWAVQGCVDWQRHGLESPAEVTAATDHYKIESDILGMFIEECCEIGDGMRENATNLYARYKEWAASGWQHAESSTKFGTQMAERGFNKEKKGLVSYLGIKLKHVSAKAA